MASKKELRALITIAGKIDPSLQVAMMKASKMNTKFAQEAKKSGGMLSRVGAIAKGVFAGNLATQAFNKITSGIMSVGQSGIKLASDLTEVQNVVDTTFRESTSVINEWSKNAVNSFGLSELQAKQFSGTLGAMLKSSGISSKNMLVMSQNLTGLAGDFASFYNLDHEQAFEKIRAGISGETEPLKQLGINMSVANLEAFALSKGIKTSYKDMDQATQTMLRYSYLMEVSKDAQGDFTKTQGNFSNQLRLLKTNWDQLTAKIAGKAIPLLTKGAQWLNKFITGIDTDKIGNMLGEIIDSASNLIGNYAPIVIGYLKEIPPIVSGIYDKAKWVADLVVDKWPMIEPIVWGITGALVASKIATWGLVAAQKAGMIIQGLSKAWQVGTAVLGMFRAGASVATVAQWALNAAMSANPIGLVVVGIGALIAAGVLLYKNWDKVSGFLVSSWEWIKKAFATGVNWVVDKINWLIQKINNIPGVEIPLVPKVQTGDKTAQTVSSGDFQAYQLKEHALGGFSNKPAIFGEAGLEAAIPIKYRNPRSISLLNQTARAIGATPAGQSIQLIYNPTIYGGNRAEIEPLLQQHKEELRQMLEDLLYEKVRVAYG